MNDILQKAADSIRLQLGAEIAEFRGELTLLVAPENVVTALRVIKDEFQFNMLMDITAVDYFPQQIPRFHLNYQLYSMQHNLMIRVRVPLEGNSPRINTSESVYANANWKEREVWDMFGIYFEGHSDMRRILMPFEWEGHPLRKDYPLGYEEPEFTHNFEEIELKKPYSKGLR